MLAWAVLAAVGRAAEQGAVLRGRTMGTGYCITLVDTPSASGSKAIAAAVQGELERLEDIFSLYRARSELSRWNAAGADQWIAVSGHLHHVAGHALQMAAATDGALDPTVAPLLKLWRLSDVRADWNPPSPDEVRAVLAAVGWRNVELRANPPAMRKLRPGVQLDLNAVVEGYAIDRVVELLKKAQVRGALVELGGEFRAWGRRGDGRPWRIGIEDPRQPSRLRAIVELADGALATSGDYRQAVLHEGRRYSHLLDPRTGAPIEHAGTAVSVLADDALTADGWATALMILGPDAGRALAERQGLAASFVRRQPASAMPEQTQAAAGRFQPLDGGTTRP